MARQEVRFAEVQRFRQPWLWGLLVLFPGGMLAALILHAETPVRKAGDTLGMAVGLAVTVLIVALFAILKLVVEVGSDGILIRFFPLTRRHIPFAEIRSFEAREYRPLLEYGGWGIRCGLGRKRAYTVRGRHGVELTLADGRRVMIGSQQPGELAEAIRLAMGRR